MLASCNCGSVLKSSVEATAVRAGAAEPLAAPGVLAIVGEEDDARLLLSVGEALLLPLVPLLPLLLGSPASATASDIS